MIQYNFETSYFLLMCRMTGSRCLPDSIDVVGGGAPEVKKGRKICGREHICYIPRD